MDKTEKVKNILAFLAILFGEKDDFFEQIMDFTPEYIIEKFERYVLSNNIQSNWGLHPSLRKSVFNRYCSKYKLLNDDV